ncbi:MAG: acyl-CoA dehydrogenase family protein [Planctomycetes bacterium]|nr:acyl-CoA dehydrogenase family protein [Planctomycetota bacterium]
MDIARTDEQKAYQETVRKFCDREVAPHAMAVDRRERSVWETYRALGKAGLLAPHYPEAYGGGGGDVTMLAILMAELSRACSATALSVGASVVLGGNSILRFGTEDHRKKHLPRIARGECITCLGLTEPGAGSDVMSISTRATREGDSWVLRGQKTFITNAPDADLFLIFAVTGEEKGRKTMGEFLIEKGAPGLTPGRPMAKFGMRGSPTSEISLEDVRVPAANVIGDPKRGFAQAMWPLTNERALAPAMAIGVLDYLLERCIRYAGERVQFGRPIGAFQAIQFKIARMRADQLVLTAMLREVISGIESGRDIRQLVSAGKILAGELAVRNSLEAMQLFGGYGYIEETGIERAIRDVKLLDIGAGTTEVQLLVIAKELLGEAAG